MEGRNARKKLFRQQTTSRDREREIGKKGEANTISCIENKKPSTILFRFFLDFSAAFFERDESHLSRTENSISRWDKRRDDELSFVFHRAQLSLRKTASENSGKRNSQK